MSTYDGAAVDQYMRSVLSQDLNDNEISNALSLLDTLTSMASANFPPSNTFIKVERRAMKFNPDVIKARGVVISVIRDGEEKRTLHIPRNNLTDLETAMDAMFFVLKNGHLMDDDDYEA